MTRSGGRLRPSHRSPQRWKANELTWALLEARDRSRLGIALADRSADPDDHASVGLDPRSPARPGGIDE